jgi:hypothetical protein
MVAGTFKEVVTVLCSVIIFGDEFHFINGMGLFVLLCGATFASARMLLECVMASNVSQNANMIDGH